MANINIEKVLIGFLKANQSVAFPVHGDKPQDTPQAYVLVDRTGGGRENKVQDRAELLVEVYHKSSRVEASDEAYRIADMLPFMLEIEPVMKLDVNSVVKLDDLIGQYNRYQVYVTIYCRRGDFDGTIEYPIIQGGGIQSIVAGDGIEVDDTDPLNPVVSATGGGPQTYDEYVYNSSGVQEGNRYNDWDDLYAAWRAGQQGPINITFEQNETLPTTEPYNLDFVKWSGDGKTAQLGGLVVTLPEGFQIAGDWINMSYGAGLGVRWEGSYPLIEYTTGINLSSALFGNVIACVNSPFFSVKVGALAVFDLGTACTFSNIGSEVVELELGAGMYALVTESAGFTDNIFIGDCNPFEALIIVNSPAANLSLTRTDANMANPVLPILSPRASLVSFDASGSGMTSQEVNSAIIEAYNNSGGGGIVDTIVAGPGISVDATNPANPEVSNDGVLGVEGAGNVSVDNTDPQNPIVSVLAGASITDFVDSDTVDFYAVTGTDPYNMGEIGDEPNTLSSGSSRKRVSVIPADRDGVLQTYKLRCWLDAGTQKMRAVVYSDNAGVPDTFLAVSDEITISNTTEAVNTFTFSGANKIPIVDGTDYHVGYVNEAAGNSLRVSTANNAGAILGNSPGYGSEPTNPFGAIDTTNNGPLDGYITVFLDNKISADVIMVDGGEF